MKILVLCYEYPPVGGGGGRVAAGVAEKLAARGHEVLFLTGSVGGLPREEVRRGVRVVRVPAPRRAADTCSIPEMAAYVLWALWPGWQMIRRERPDVLHVHFAVPTGAVGWTLSLLTGVPYLLTAHLGDVPGGVPEQTGNIFRWIKPLTQPIWRRAAGVTAVSGFVASLAEAAYGRRPEIIHNGIEFTPSEIVPRSEGPVRFLYAGRISVQKNLLLALQGFALVEQKDWKFDIVGDGPLRAEAEQFCVRYQILDQVTFHGWLEADALARLRRSSHVLVLPSRQEGLPMAAVEALADGLALVGSDIPGLADVVVDESNGVLCRQEPEAFASAFSRLIGNPDLLLNMRKESMAKAEAFAIGGIIDRYEAALRRAAGE